MSNIYVRNQTSKVDIGQGISFQMIGKGQNFNAIYWNLPDRSIIPEHSHPQEQFGYVVQGDLELNINGQTLTVTKGNSYVIPSGEVHSFKAIGLTEVIDIFSPPRDLSTAGGRRTPSV